MFTNSTVFYHLMAVNIYNSSRFCFISVLFIHISKISSRDSVMRFWSVGFSSNSSSLYSPVRGRYTGTIYIFARHSWRYSNMKLSHFSVSYADKWWYTLYLTQRLCIAEWQLCGVTYTLKLHSIRQSLFCLIQWNSSVYLTTRNGDSVV